MFDVMKFLRNFKPSSNQNPHQKILLGDQLVILNSRGLIPVIIQKKIRGKSKVLNLVHMNREALKLSIETGELYIYRRSKECIERMGSKDSADVFINSLIIAKNRRSLLATVTSKKANIPKQFFIYEVDLKLYKKK